MHFTEEPKLKKIAWV